MANVTLKGNPCNTKGELPAIGAELGDFEFANKDLSRVRLSDFKGSKLILNIFPSIDTGTCATSVRTFNKKASELVNTKVLCISKDLPFAQGRFCGAEGIENVEVMSDFATGKFGDAMGLTLENGPLKDLHARAIVVLDENGIVKHTELVSEIVDEPNYESAIKAL